MSIFTTVKFAIAAVAAAFVQTTASAQSLNITVEEAGTLSTLVGDAAYTTTSLTVSGPLNSADILFLRRMMGRDSTSSGTTAGTLSTLDMANATIVAGGGNYYTTRSNTANVLGQYSFQQCANLTSLVLPNSIIEVGNYSLQRTSITSITIPESVKTIGISAFANSSLESITIPSTVTSLGNYAFSSSSIGTADLSAATSITAIPTGAFSYCANLTTITLPSSVTAIEASAFAGSGLTSFTFPANLTRIGNLAFQSDTLLTSLGEIPATVDSIGYSAFQGVNVAAYSVASGNSRFTAVDGVIYDNGGKTLIAYPTGSTATSFVVPTEVDSIALSAFFRSGNLTQITLPEGLGTISSACFRETGLTTLNLPSSIYYINSSAFYASRSLTEVTFQGPTFIASQAFQHCTNLDKLYFLSETPPTLNTAGLNFNYCADVLTAYIPEGESVLTAYNTAMANAKTTGSLVFSTLITGITDASVSPYAVEVARYNTAGQKLSAPAFGINIVKYSDGTVRKEVVK